jgi:hypothetical protein
MAVVLIPSQNPLCEMVKGRALRKITGFARRDVFDGAHVNSKQKRDDLLKEKTNSLPIFGSSDGVSPYRPPPVDAMKEGAFACKTKPSSLFVVPPAKTALETKPCVVS